MRALLITCAAGIFGAAVVGVGSEPVAADPVSRNTLVPLVQTFRACDFTPAINMQSKGHGTARAIISVAAARTVNAQVQLIAAEPATHYTVRLIQSPRPSVSCAAGDPGVTAAGMDTDSVGTATLVLQGLICAGTTGAWVFIDRPSEHSQTPAEYYTSEIMATI